jgi:hypothetical protein
MHQTKLIRPPSQNMLTMYDLPNQLPEERKFHNFQMLLLRFQKNIYN